MAKAVMFQGTSSNVGKSILCAALCRIMFRSGYRVAPFKSQNMALNSGPTPDGGEIGRAQLVQAHAAGVVPRVEMNPVLLKPTAPSVSQVILMGRPVANISAGEYHGSYNLKLWPRVEEAYRTLQGEYEIIVIEGAGSPAEVNLKEHEIANMRVAKMAGSPVILVADIDRGGAMASIVGTLELLEPDEKELVAGLVINKFRGDINLLKPALSFLEEKTGKPILGVIPYVKEHGLPEEDSVVLESYANRHTAAGEIEIAVIKTPCIANFTDFDPLMREKDVNLCFISRPEELGHPDMVILPGSKNTINDLLWLRNSGMEKAIHELVQKNIPLLGICGGYQMLGVEINDPDHVESENDSIGGLGYLPVTTVFKPTKETNLVRGRIKGEGIFLGPLRGREVEGYEIHMGESYLQEGGPAFEIYTRGINNVKICDGAEARGGLIWGTYIHGIWDNDFLRRHILNVLRECKGNKKNHTRINFLDDRDRRMDNLAEVVAKHLDLEKIAAIMGLDRPLKGDSFGS